MTETKAKSTAQFRTEFMALLAACPGAPAALAALREFVARLPAHVATFTPDDVPTLAADSPADVLPRVFAVTALVLEGLIEARHQPTDEAGTALAGGPYGRIRTIPIEGHVDAAGNPVPADRVYLKTWYRVVRPAPKE